MKLSDRITMSIQSLFKRKLRTVLTVLGVVIGIASIVIMIALGEGMNRKSMEQIEKYGGLKTIIVSEGDGSSNNSSADTAAITYGSSSKEKGALALKLTDDTVNTIKNMEHVELVSPVLEFQCIIKSGQYEAQMYQCDAYTLEALRDMKWQFSEGGLPAEGDPLEFIYGNFVLQQFQNSHTNQSYWDTQVLPDIDLMKDPMFTIFDTDAYEAASNTSSNEQQGADTAEKSDSSSVKTPPKKYIIPTAGVLYGEGDDDYRDYSYNVYCDIEALKTEYKKIFRNKAIPGQPVRTNGTPYKQLYYSSIYVKVDDVNNVSTVQKNITDLGYRADSNSEWVEQTKEESRSMQAMLGGIGAVSLLVAAIGIANTMMMSIYERTKEIGIMKVLGCDLKDIQSLFLIEAAFIGFTGGVAGIGLSYFVSLIINLVTHSATAVVPLWLPFAAIIFAVLVGMAAGFMPSKRAMQLSPLAAIRNE